METSFPEIKTSYRVKKMVTDLGHEFELYKDLLKDTEKVIEWSEDKKTIVNNEQVQESFNDLYEHEFEFRHDPLTADEIVHIKNLTPMELDILAMICEPNSLDFLQS